MFEGESVWERECWRESVGEREIVCVCERECGRERVCVGECVWEREWEYV